ncbi:MAG: DUF4954 family protein [Muribaculaceae bacterium]|nr:DUF4954 family protein [Muribaculaceae bacterium]
MRQLTESDITILKANGCRCRQWERLHAAEPFNPDHYRNVEFSGDVQLGTTSEKVLVNGIFPRSTGIYNAFIHDCTIGNEVLIEGTGRFIACCDIADGAVLIHNDMISISSAEKGSSFGEGTEVSVLDETGSKAVLIFSKLSAPAAHLCVTDKDARIALNSLTKKYAAKQVSNRCSIGRNTRVINCGSLTDVRIGECAVLEGVTRLHNGTINSSEKYPAKVLDSVEALNFIISEGSTVSQATHLTNCYVGQSVELENFSASESLIFSNSCLVNGEGAAMLAGPFTVSHHKSTLLIGGELLMYNAGSGTNQSNHLYKLGPMHYGFMSRGAKCASDSYVIWPARIGEFTLVSGRHYCHPDTIDFPFSYLVNDPDGSSRLIPAIAAEKCGTLRDIKKWHDRDKRPKELPDDTITHSEYSPYTVVNAVRGLKKLQALVNSEPGQYGDFRLQGGLKISRRAVDRGIRHYVRYLSLAFGQTIHRILAGGKKPDDPTDTSGYKWLDLCGFVVPEQMIEPAMAKLKGGRFKTPQQFCHAIASIEPKASEAERLWLFNAALRFMDECGHGHDLAWLMSQYYQSKQKQLSSVVADIAKEAEIFGESERFTNVPMVEALEAEINSIAASLEQLGYSL